MIYKNRKFDLKGGFSVSNKEIEFRNCEFLGERGFEVVNSSIRFCNCIFSKFDVDILECENSICSFESCRFLENGSDGLFISLLSFDNSNISIEKCEFINNISPVLEAKGSNVNIENSLFLNNRGYAIFSSNCNLNLRLCKFEDNGSFELEANQITLESTKARILETKIYGRKSGVAIFMRGASDVEVVDCEFKANLGGVYVEDVSSLTMKRSELVDNRDNGDEFLQVFLNESKAYLESTRIVGGNCGLYCQKGSSAHLKDCVVSNNDKGLCLFEFSEVMLDNCEIKDNVREPQIYCEESKLKFKDSKVFSKSGVLIELMNPVDFDFGNSEIDKDRIKLDT